MAARIFAIADAFDTSAAKLTGDTDGQLEDVLQEIEKESGTYFDPVLTSTFIKYAPAMFKRLSSMDTAQLDKELDATLKRYFRV